MPSNRARGRRSSLKKILGKRALGARHLWKKALRKGGTDIVDLGSGDPPGELREFSEKPYRKLVGIDEAYSSWPERALRKKAGSASLNDKSRIRLVAGLIEEKIPARRNSVRHFRMTMVLSSLSKELNYKSARGKTTVFGEIAKKVHNALVPGGRFRIVDKKSELAEASKVLEKQGFKVSLWPADESAYKGRQFIAYWARDYASQAKIEAAAGKVKKKEDHPKWPWVLVAVKR